MFQVPLKTDRKGLDSYFGLRERERYHPHSHLMMSSQNFKRVIEKFSKVKKFYTGNRSKIRINALLTRYS